MSATNTACRRCHRPLRDAASIRAGIGPRCARLETIGGTHSPAQVADAQELVELGGVIPLRGRGARRAYLTLGHNGDVYRTTIGGQCNCRAGLAGKACFHAAAVAIYATPAGRTPRIAHPMPPATYIAAA